jgi:hypothetical protein
MPIYDFDTPDPILATVGRGLGHVRIAARDRAGTTVVDVRPSDRSDPCDVATAAQARVSYAAGELVVSVPKAQDLPGSGAVIVDIKVPDGSRVHADALAADFHSAGRLGECRITTGCGHIRLAHTGPLHLSVVLGNVTVERAVGDDSGSDWATRPAELCVE